MPQLSLKNAAPWLPVILALAFFLQGLFGSLEKSLTWDEPTFIVSGYTYLTRNDFRLNPEAPPLMQQLEALPLLFMDLNVPGEGHPDWQKPAQVPYARRFMVQNRDKIRTIALWARMPVLLLGAGLILAIAAWTRRLYGPLPALAAAGTAAFSPNLLAHAGLATTDLGCAAGMFLATWAFWRAVHSKTTGAWALCGLATGLALLAKFTALLLGPAFLLLAALHLARNRAEWPALLRGLTIAAGVALLALGAGYNLSFNPLRYAQGLQKVYSHSLPGYRFYLFGQVSGRPWWYYHIAAFAVKVPLPVLLFLALAAVQAVRSSGCREAACYLLVPAGLVIAASCFDRTNLGLRRILPAFPFIFAFAAHALAGPKDRLLPWAVAALVAWTAVEAARIYPHHLAYFNTLAGGPERGPYLLDDSNIDWGQDLPALAAYQRAHPDARPLKLRYFGALPPDLYGVDAIPIEGRDILSPRPGVYAISAHYLAWFRKLQKQTGRNIDWLARYRPAARAGYSIYIYRFP